MAATQELTTVISINARTGNGFSQVGATLTELGTMVDGLSQDLINFGKDSIGVYRDYEKSMKDAEVALSTLYGRGTKELAGVMTQLDASATDWAATTIFHTNDVANAISEAAHAGWDYNQIMSGLPAAMQLAQAGGLDLSEAVNYIVKSTNAAGVEFGDMADFIDLWTFAANSSASTIGEFGDAMLRMGSTMRFAGSTEELMTLIAVTANAGSVGSEAGTMIRNSMMRLIAPTDKAKDAMALLGATSEETASLMDDQALAAANAELAAHGFSAYSADTGELKNILDIYRELYVALGEIAGGYENIDRNQDALQILAAIFPTRTITEALTLLRGASEEYDGLYESMMNGDAAGYGEYAAETQMDSLYGRIETFYSKVERLKQLTGEELSGPLGDVLGGLGDFVDSISELDEDKFSMLMRAVEGVAAAGPAFLALGAGFRFIGALGTPVGSAATLITALVSLGLVLEKASEIRFESNFGDMELDLDALKANVDNLTTDAEQQVATIEEYVTRISELSEDYKTAMTAFSTDLSTYVLTGKELTAEEKDSLLKYGESITDTVIEGINTRKESSLTFLNAITPDADSMTEEEFAAYNDMYGWLTEYFGGLQTEAEGIGTQLQQAILDGLDDDGVIDEKERSIIQKYTDMLNRIESTISQADYYSELEKAGRISEDSLEEYMDYLGENHEQRVEEMNAAYDSQIGFARAAYEDELGRRVSDEEWQQTDQYKLYQDARQEGIGQIDSQTAELARTAVESLMRDSDMTDTWSFLERVSQEAPRDKSGYIALTNEDWMRYFAEGAIPENFMSDISTLEGSSRLYAGMLKDWQNDPAISALYNMFGGTSDIVEIAGRARQFQESLPGSTSNDRFGYYVGDDGLEHTALQTYGYQYTQPSEVATDTGGQVTYTAPIGPVQVPAQLYSDGSLESTMAASPVPVPIEPYTEGMDGVSALQDQGVEVQVGGNTEQLQATIDGADGQNLMAYVDGDVSDLSMRITDQNGKTLVENVTGNAAMLASVINSYNGRTITVNVTGRKLFAEGGRATSASVFGEAGPEWAIPEEHSARTADLLNAARAASGFTWPELLERYGGLNAGTNRGNTTLVYSPIINAADATGVDAALQEDKKRLDAWYEEKQMRDEMEVYQ